MASLVSAASKSLMSKELHAWMTTTKLMWSPMYASVFVPAGKSVGAGAVRKAFMESLQNAAAAMLVPAPLRLVESYRWVLVVEPASAERAVFFYAVV